MIETPQGKRRLLLAALTVIALALTIFALLALRGETLRQERLERERPLAVDLLDALCRQTTSRSDCDVYAEVSVPNAEAVESILWCSSDYLYPLEAAPEALILCLQRWDVQTP